MRHAISLLCAPVAVLALLLALPLISQATELAKDSPSVTIQSAHCVCVWRGDSYRQACRVRAQWRQAGYHAWVEPCGEMYEVWVE